MVACASRAANCWSWTRRAAMTCWHSWWYAAAASGWLEPAQTTPSAQSTQPSSAIWRWIASANRAGAPCSRGGSQRSSRHAIRATRTSSAPAAVAQSCRSSSSSAASASVGRSSTASAKAVRRAWNPRGKTTELSAPAGQPMSSSSASARWHAEASSGVPWADMRHATARAARPREAATCGSGVRPPRKGSSRVRAATTSAGGRRGGRLRPQHIRRQARGECVNPVRRSCDLKHKGRVGCDCPADPPDEPLADWCRRALPADLAPPDPCSIR